MPVQPHVPDLLSTWLAPFRSGLTGPTFRHALVLVMGALLTPGRRTVTAMLTVVGLARTRSFTNYHRVLNRNQWSSREVARRLLGLLVASFVPAGPVIIALDDTLERRWGAGSRLVAFTGIRSAPPMAISSKPRDCAGCPSCCSSRSRGPVACGPCPS